MDPSTKAALIGAAAAFLGSLLGHAASGLERRIAALEKLHTIEARHGKAGG
jgi:hypothetical protein